MPVVPREIQMALVGQAREKNLIVLVESEATKASLAALVIKDTLERLAQLQVGGFKDSNIVIPFLITSTAQARTKSLEILKVYACRIGMFLKKKGCKKEEMGEDILKHHNIIFMEAMTLHRLLDESLITMDKEFYHKVPNEDYHPKLLGLTSLPLVDSLDKENLNKLKSMFAAELHIVSISEGAWFKESILRYSSAEKYAPTLLIARLLNGTSEVAKRIHPKAVDVNEQLGPLCSTLFIHHVLTKLPPEAATMDSYLPLLCSFSGKLLESISLQLSSVSYKFPPEQITPKVHTLLMYLLAVHHLPKQVILHVESRSVGIGLQLLIQASKRLEGINCRCLFGAGSKNGIKATTMDQVEIDAVQKSFRVGETKLLIACRALEEGLELPFCDVAIQFDFLPNLALYSQFRSRARDYTSQRILLVEKEYDAALCRMKVAEDATYKWYRSLHISQDSVAGFITTSLQNNYEKPNNDIERANQVIGELEAEISGEIEETMPKGYESKVPDFWISDNTTWTVLWFNVVYMGPAEGSYCPFALITRQRFPDTQQLHIIFNGSHLPARIVPAQQSISPPQEQTYHLVSFTISVLELLSPNNKQTPDDLAFLLAPLSFNYYDTALTWDHVDWPSLSKADKLTQFEGTTYVGDLIVCESNDPFCLYYLSEEACNYIRVSSSHEIDPCFLKPVLSHKPRKIILKVKSCLIHWLPPPFMNSIKFLPYLVYRINAILLTKEVKVKLGLGFIRDEFLLNALTFKSARLEVNYERLELLGDTFLKLIASLSIYIQAPGSSTGKLFLKYTNIIKNETLSRLARNQKLPTYFIAQPFEENIWCPPSRIKTPGLPRKFASKPLADVVEAILAASLLSVGESQSIHCAKLLGIQLGEFHCWEDFRSAYSQLPMPQPRDYNFGIDIGPIQAIIGYQFKSQQYLMDAFAWISLSKKDAQYHRLLLLGDALLSYFVVSYLYLKFPDATPGVLTVKKDICMKKSALITAMDSLKLHHHIKLPGQASSAHILLMKSPKSFSNGITAIMGAIFFDSGFEFEAVLAFFNRHMREYCDRHISVLQEAMLST